QATPYDEKSRDQFQRLLNDKGLKDWFEAVKDSKDYQEAVRAVGTLRRAPEQNAEYQRLISRRLEELHETVGGKVVIIGMTGTGLASDSKPTPLHSACPGA